MSAKSFKSRFLDLAPYAIGSAVGAVIAAMVTPSASEAFRDVQGEVNGYRARAAGGLVFETKSGTANEKKCLAEAKEFIQTLPENFIAPIRDHGVFVRVAEIDHNEAPNFRPSTRRVTLHYNKETQSCDTSFSAAHELGHAFDAAQNMLSEGAAYRAVLNEALESPDLKKILSNPAAQAELSAASNGNPEKLIRDEAFADLMACALVPGASERNFLGLCQQPAAAKARSFVAATFQR